MNVLFSYAGTISSTINDRGEVFKAGESIAAKCFSIDTSCIFTDVFHFYKDVSN